MKYFPYELFIALNMETTSDEQLEQIDRQWELNSKKYSEVYKSLSERLPEDVYNHFYKMGFHDYRLVKMDIEHTSLLRSNVHLTLAHDAVDIQKSVQWLLSFENISFFQFDHHNYDNPRPILHPEIDNWLYEEITPIDDSTLSFEILFSSGGNIRIHFPDKEVRMRRIQ